MIEDKNKIDFVILWVDPNDKEWQSERKKYATSSKESQYIDNNIERYRDWGMLKYWFRGIEKYAPWVNKIHFVTYGHVPEWLNIDHPKINIVKHSEIMPKDSLPTFNSNAIGLCVHKIPNLTKQFVVFDDDMYLLKKVREKDFFKKGQPLNTMSLLAITPKQDRQFSRTLLNNVEIINDNFNFSQIKKKNLSKFLSIKQRKYLLTTIPLLFYNDCPGFKNYHIPISYLKSTYEQVWSIEKNKLGQTVHSKFRNYEKNISHWVMNYWQFMTGDTLQRSGNFGISLTQDNKKLPNIIMKSKYHFVCINDVDSPNLDIQQRRINKAFEKKLGEKSSFEK